MFLRLSAGRGCSAWTDVPFLNWRPKAEGWTGFFFAHISPERESDVKLSFYVTREKTAVSASFGYTFPVILLLSTASKPCCQRMPAAGTVRGMCRRTQQKVGGASICGCLIASIQGIRFICVTNGFCKLNLTLEVMLISKSPASMCKRVGVFNKMCN